jgi:hypothetical protein
MLVVMLVVAPDANLRRWIDHRVVEGAMHLVLDLDPDSEPVRGQVGPVNAAPTSFTGYAELIATLESIRAAASLGRGAPPDRSRA